MLSWTRSNSTRYQPLSSRHQSPAPTNATPPDDTADAFPRDVVAAAFWVEHAVRVLSIYYVLLRVWNFRFYILIAIVGYAFVLYDRGDLNRQTLTHHATFGRLLWRQVSSSGQWLHLLSLIATDFCMTMAQQWMQQVRDTQTPAAPEPRSRRNRHYPENVFDFGLGPLWGRISGGIESLFRPGIRRTDSFGLPPSDDRDDWVDDDEREAFTQFLLAKYRQSTETELRLDCPITKELMRYPVVAADGFTYEAKAIERWIRLAKDTPRSPITGEVLRHKALVPNHTLRSIIEAHKEEFRRQQRQRGRHTRTPRSAGSPFTW